MKLENPLVQRPARRKSRGFTLMEVMIVVAIVGILAAVGYPAYVQYTDRARRTDGKALLMDAQARMERYYFDNNSYTATLADLGYASGTVTSGEQNYTLAAAAGPTGSITTSYLLTATPNPAKPFDDPECGDLTLDSRGQQGNTGSEPLDKCWGK